MTAPDVPATGRPVILLTGAAGQLGHELRATLAPLGEVYAVTRAECDLTDESALRTLLRRVRPALIVNPAAFNAVDRAEAEPALAHAVNARVPAILGEEATALGASVVHFSTDFVFDGSKGAPYTEGDAPNPLGAYAASKLEGERALAATGAVHVALRTSWVVGAHGENFARAVLRLAAAHDELRMVADQTSIPTPTPALAAATARIGARLLEALGAVPRGSYAGVVAPLPAGVVPQGVYHLASAGAATRYAYAQFVLAEARAAGVALRLTPERMHPVTAEAFAAPARRPADSRLASHRAARELGVALPDWRLGVRAVLRQILSA